MADQDWWNGKRVTDAFSELVTPVRRFVQDTLIGLPVDETQARILTVLRDGPLSSNELATNADLGPAQMYPAIVRLEAAGKILSDWQPGTYPRRRIYRLPASAYTNTPSERDMDANPYSPDEQRVVDWLIKRTGGNVGAGPDPIGFLLASYELLAMGEHAPPTREPELPPT